MEDHKLNSFHYPEDPESTFIPPSPTTNTPDTTSAQQYTAPTPVSVPRPIDSTTEFFKVISYSFLGLVVVNVVIIVLSINFSGLGALAWYLMLTVPLCILFGIAWVISSILYLIKRLRSRNR